ncbi:transcriptional regulator [Photobacterium japonica]|uniref:winged helix-turn-helix domain-containing protein n=1 Tax=Photobacterium japonica TaxID=2910235 RepID=UPI003D116040
MNTTETKFLIGQRFLFIPHDNSLIDQCEDEEITRLGSNESRALSLLIEAPGAIVTRTRLHDYVWREQGFEVDDSSLTQAISTLRKALKDATKSPEFIKTVPKRGYQMIAPVEPITPPPAPAYSATNQHRAAEDGSHAPSITDSEATPQATMLSDDASSASTDAAFSHAHHAAQTHHRPTHTTTPSREAGHAWPRRAQWIGTSIVLLIALLLPVWVNQSLPPVSAAFTPIEHVDGVPILVPNHNPDLTPWQPLITQCVKRYITHHPDALRPVEVIATGGQNSQIWLNYVHTSQRPSENVTLRLLTSQKDNTTICQ